MRTPMRVAAAGSSDRNSTFHASFWERLEARVLLCVDHGGPGGKALTAEYVDYLNSLPPESPMPFDVTRAIAHDAPSGGGGETGVQSDAAVTTILDNGPSSNRIDIVIVGDGYTSAQLGTYATQAQNAANLFFLQGPLNVYKSLFNVHRVDVISNESGVDNDPVPGIFRDTALDMEFWCFDIERLLCVDPTKAISFALNAPDVDQVLAVANSTKYGGAGYSESNLGTFSGGHGSALEIALHEFGHAFADLADEYDYGDGATYFGPEPFETNITKQTAAQIAASQTKWHRWLDLPDVDAFQGAGYHQFGLYRPTFNSKMRSLGQPWGAVNAEQLVVSAYKTVRPIDDATPPGTYNNTQTFFVDPVGTVPTLRVEWLVDGVVVPGATATTFDPAPLHLSGIHTLTARVTDITTIVRDPALRAAHMTETRTWTLLDAQPPAVSTSAFEVDAPSMRARFTFTEDVGASLAREDLVLENRTTGQVIPASQLALDYEAAARTATFTFPGFEHGVLPDASYRATIPAGSVSDPTGNALAADAVLEFVFLQGDATRDGRVNLDDFNILAENFGQTGTVFTRGDFNYDGESNLDDFNILASRFGIIVPTARLPLADPGAEVGTEPEDETSLAL